MADSSRVLVVGTTSDYIHWLRNARPNGSLFLTDPILRQNALEPPPEPHEEICCDLSDTETVMEALLQHINKYSLHLTGIGCFDCENMLLAARLAERLGLAYPTPAAILNCRSKLASKQHWQDDRVPCPSFQTVANPDDAEAFAQSLPGPCVVKPLSGAGSELTYRCENGLDARTRFGQIRLALRERRKHPMFNQIPDGLENVLLEEWIEGTEYSCDFVVEENHATIIRMARKYPRRGGPFGITEAYQIVTDCGPFDTHQLTPQLTAAAASLGLHRAYCMIDIIDRGGTPVFIEMAPRPGGDCLPWLLRQSAGLDILHLYLGFCQGRSCLPPSSVSPYVALRLFADQDGRVQHVDTKPLAADPRVREIYLKCRPGNQIRRPPEDYDSWILGHVVYEPDPTVPVESQNRELANMVAIRWG